MKTFGTITGLLSIFGFFLGFQNIFPEYSNYLIYSAFISIGLSLGLIISFFDKKINIQVYKISSVNLFVYSFYLGILILSITMLVLYPENFLKIIGSIGFFTFLSFWPVLGLIKGNGVTISERIFLANKYENEGNISESLGHYFEIIDGMNEKDERYKGINKKISELKKKQIL